MYFKVGKSKRVARFRKIKRKSKRKSSRSGKSVRKFKLPKVSSNKNFQTFLVICNKTKSKDCGNVIDVVTDRCCVKKLKNKKRKTYALTAKYNGRQYFRIIKKGDGNGFKKC